MKHKRFFRISLAVVCAAALAVPVVGQAGSSNSNDSGRTFYATDDQGQLLSFSADSPRQLDSLRKISGLPPGVSLKGIDFRPATGDLYGVGSDSVVYRLNPFTAIAVAEGPAFTPALRGRFFGWDFNPQVDRIRLTSDANQNQRLHPDDANVVGLDADLNPNDPTVVGSAYTNNDNDEIVVAPAMPTPGTTGTMLFGIDSGTDSLVLQAPPNDGVLSTIGELGARTNKVVGFDVLSKVEGGKAVANTAYASLRKHGRTRLYEVDLATGDTDRIYGYGRSWAFAHVGDIAIRPQG